MFDDLARFVPIVFGSLLVRYAFYAGLAFLLFYGLLRQVVKGRKIQPVFPQRGDYLREIGYSMGSIVIFTAVGWLAMGPHLRGVTLWYFDVERYGWGYFAFSVVAMILIHDAYFYWTHRLMHWRPVYRWFHRVHHRSVNPSPWSAFAFHPLEAAVEASIMLVFAFLLPVHPYALVLFLAWMTFFNVFGHLGYEFFPKWLTRHPLGRWLNTSTNHNLHHKYFRQNYGLYFRWWDIWMGTTHSNYRAELAEVQERPYLAPESRPALTERAIKLWMATPYLAVGVGLLLLHNAWVALLGFHGCMIAALVLHRDRWDCRLLWRGGRILWLGAITLSIVAFVALLLRLAGQHQGYGDYLSGLMASLGLGGWWSVVFAVYLCLVNPVLEEAFWRGLFAARQPWPVLPDLAYGGFHFLVLLPFMYASYALVGAVFLMGMGYLWRQMANRSNGLALPVTWHALGDLALMVVASNLMLT